MADRMQSRYSVGEAANVEARPLPPSSEVRLPQGLRFTDVRRSNLGDFGMARSGARTPKSCGCPELRPPS